jgi:hypothetical protein
MIYFVFYYVKINFKFYFYDVSHLIYVKKRLIS